MKTRSETRHGRIFQKTAQCFAPQTRSSCVGPVWHAGDRYSVKLFCRSIECNLNGKSSKDSFAPFFSDKAAAMFSEVHSMASSVKQQVELCIFDQGIENVERCSTGNSAKLFENSFGWDLSHEPQYYESK